MELHVVGGCYLEVCDWPSHQKLQGSAGRAANLLGQLSQSNDVHLHSVLDKKSEDTLRAEFQLNECVFHIQHFDETISFRYAHPLASPTISPERILFEDKQSFEPTLPSNPSVLMFGMLEAVPCLKVDSAVYDPQDAYRPLLFSETGSKARRLAVVLNAYEASQIYQRIEGFENSNVCLLAEWIMDRENADTVVIKKGKEGAYVLEKGREGVWVSAYKTTKVFPIGSGDVFSGAFFYYWCGLEYSAYESAKMASAVAAYYCETQTFPFGDAIPEYISTAERYTVAHAEPKQVYLAGPFFTLQQMWLINQAKKCIQEIGFKVFSPYHDVGVGTADEVVDQDVKAIDECDVLYALFDDHDPGTLFEIGLAIKSGKSVVIFSENSTREHLKMFEGTNCIICDDFSTSIYKLGWLQ